MKIGRGRQKLINWPPLAEVESLRWANNHTQYKSATYGFCEAQDCCEVCDSRIRMLCKTKCLIDRLRLRIIKKHYKIKNWW